jgi:hypothetical protein
VLLDEGKASKQFTPAEENRLFDLLSGIMIKHEGGHFTLKEVRKYGHFSESDSDKSLSSNLMRKWISEGKIERTKKGHFRFLAPPEKLEDTASSDSKENVLEKIEELSKLDDAPGV